MSQGELPPAGYYPDPDNPAVQRWWDGREWAVPPPAPPEAGGPPAAAPDRASTNVYAIASLAFGLAWVAFIGSILAVVFGHIALAQIRAAGGRETGRGIAIAGLIVGYIGVGALVALIVLVATAP